MGIFSAGPDPIRLAVAAHEIGHMVAWQSAGLPIREVRVTGRGERSSGHVTTGRQPVHTTQQARAYVVGILAGPAAGARWMAEHRIRTDAYNCHDDMDAYARHRAHAWCRGMSDRQFQRAAERLVNAHWAEILELAPQLAAAGRL